MDQLRTDLNDAGILVAEGLFSVSQLAVINHGLDPFLAAKRDEKRSYASASELIDLGIMDDVLNDTVVSSFFDIMDDPKMYQFTVFEIAGNNNIPHVADANLSGWHRDHDSEYNPASPSHVSLFCYLSDVGPDDGAFEFMPHSGTGKFINNSSAAVIQGKTGTSFFWNRHFFHRASPNRGATRRRVLKFSIQNAASPALDKELLGVATYMAGRDDARRSLFGHPALGQGQALKPSAWNGSIPPVSITVNIKRTELVKARIKQSLGLLDTYTKEVGNV